MTDSDQQLALCQAFWLGAMEYQAAWDLQEGTAAKVAGGQSAPALLLLEHPHTYTFGRRGEAAHLLWDEDELRRRGVAVHWVDRGGDVTYHGPGQLVGYPVIPLAQPGWQGSRLPQADFVGYLRKLEEVLILTLASFGIPSGQRPGLTGVWVPADVRARCLRCDPALVPEPAKIASIGVKIDSRGVTRHGFALNVDPDMQYWQGMVPCGIDGVSMTCMAELLNEVPSTQAVAERLAQEFARVFNLQLKWKPAPSGEPVQSENE